VLIVLSTKANRFQLPRLSPTSQLSRLDRTDTVRQLAAQKRNFVTHIERREAVGRMARYAGNMALDVGLDNASLEQTRNGSSRVMFRRA
jgi:hypothetical protein